MKLRYTTSAAKRLFRKVMWSSLPSVHAPPDKFLFLVGEGGDASTLTAHSIPERYLIGVDIDTQCVESAKTRWPNAAFFNCSIEEYAENKWDDGIGCAWLDFCGTMNRETLACVQSVAQQMQISKTRDGRERTLAVSFLKGRDPVLTGQSDVIVPDVTVPVQLRNSIEKTNARWRQSLADLLTENGDVLSILREDFPSAKPHETRMAVIREVLRATGNWVPAAVGGEYMGSSPMVTFAFRTTSFDVPYTLLDDCQFVYRKDEEICNSTTGETTFGIGDKYITPANWQVPVNRLQYKIAWYTYSKSWSEEEMLRCLSKTPELSPYYDIPKAKASALKAARTRKANRASQDSTS
jgi:hypothetical protein